MGLELIFAQNRAISDLMNLRDEKLDLQAKAATIRMNEIEKNMNIVNQKVD